MKVIVAPSWIGTSMLSGGAFSLQNAETNPEQILGMSAETKHTNNEAKRTTDTPSTTSEQLGVASTLLGLSNGKVAVP
jgi:hypothetical protein